MKSYIVGLVSLTAVCLHSADADGIRLEGYDYPYPVEMFGFSSQKQALEMAFMDVRPKGDKADAVVLLHGKNFSAAYWGETAAALRDAGYRVIIPDQVGFGKSSKPDRYQFSFQQLALNTHDLLTKCGVKTAHIVGHSMGGVVAARYALMYPQETRSLTFVNPIGLEDWKAKGVPYVSIDRAYEQELNQTPEKIRAYQTENYYPGKWKPEYERWVEMLAMFLHSPEYPRMAWDQALTSDMIFTQPVCYEFGDFKIPVLLIIGQNDRTALGKDRVSEAVRKTLGNYPELGRKAAASIPHASLVELDGLGHLPHIEAFPRFIAPLKAFLNSHVSSPKGN